MSDQHLYDASGNYLGRVSSQGPGRGSGYGAPGAHVLCLFTFLGGMVLIYYLTYSEGLERAAAFAPTSYPNLNTVLCAPFTLHPFLAFIFTLAVPVWVAYRLGAREAHDVDSVSGEIAGLYFLLTCLVYVLWLPHPPPLSLARNLAGTPPGTRGFLVWWAVLWLPLYLCLVASGGLVWFGRRRAARKWVWLGVLAVVGLVLFYRIGSWLFAR